jgi:hypothetical protein
MTVQDIIFNLQKHYKPDDELIIDWWDKDWFEQKQGNAIDEGLWNEFVGRVSDEITYHNEIFAEQAMELLDEMNTLEESC